MMGRGERGGKGGKGGEGGKGGMGKRVMMDCVLCG